MTQRPSHPPARSQPVLWWELINEAEALAARRNIGLASVWQWIHRENYQRARAALEEVAEAWREFPAM